MRLPRSAYCLTNFGCRSLYKPEHVLNDEHLAVATGAGADADGWNADHRGDARCQLGGNALEDERERAGPLDGFGVADQLFGVALHAKTAKSMDRLGRQPDMPHHRNVGANDCGHGIGATHAPLHLDRVRAPFFHQSAGALKRLLRAELIRHERQIGDQQARVTPRATHFVW